MLYPGERMNFKLENDFYIIDNNYKLVSFNDTVRERYKGIKEGDYCYKATMNRESPCLHCPLAGNSKTGIPMYYDPFYGGFVEAIFSDIGDNKYAVVCHPARNYDTLEIVHALSVLFYSVHKIDLVNNQFLEIKTLPNVTKVIGKTGNAKEALDLFTNLLVDEKHREKIQKFNDVTILMIMR